jgi:hypothetical protein
MLESEALADLIYATLHGDATLMATATGGVWRDVAAEEATYPFAVFQVLVSTPTNTLSGVTRFANLQIMIKAVDQSAAHANTRTIIDRARALLAALARNTVSGGTLFPKLEELGGPQIPIEYDDGVPYASLALIYGCQAQTL